MAMRVLGATLWQQKDRVKESWWWSKEVQESTKRKRQVRKNFFHIRYECLQNRITYYNTMNYYTTLTRMIPGGAKYHDYPLAFNINLNTSTTTAMIRLNAGAFVGFILLGRNGTWRKGKKGRGNVKQQTRELSMILQKKGVGIQ